MASAGQPMKNEGFSAEDLAALAALFTSKTGSTSSTTKSNLTKEGMDAVIAQVLGGTNGLAAIANGEKTAGLYNSSTNQLLTNDLITRTAGELAKQQAGTTTSANTRQDPTFSPGKTAATVGSLSLINTLLKESGGLSGIAGMLKGLVGGENGITVDKNGVGTNNSGLTPQQMETAAPTTEMDTRNIGVDTPNSGGYSTEDLDTIDWSAYLAESEG
jgi:hypothetical protein